MWRNKEHLFLIGDTPCGDTPGGDTPGGDTPCGDTPCGDTPCGDTSHKSLSLAFEAVQPRLPKSGLWTSVFLSNQLLINTTSGHGIHATASRPSQPAWSITLDGRPVVSPASPSRSVNDLARHQWSCGPRRTGFLSGRAVVRDALASTVPTSS